jgi:hypothetical protein
LTGDNASTGEPARVAFRFTNIALPGKRDAGFGFERI